MPKSLDQKGLEHHAVQFTVTDDVQGVVAQGFVRPLGGCGLVTDPLEAVPVENQ